MSIDITRRRGDTRRVTFKIADTNGSAIDLTDWTAFYLTVNSEEAPADNTNEVAQLTGVVTDTRGGRVYFVVDGTIPIGEYFYDVQAIDANGEKTTLVSGTYNVVQDITKV